MANKTDMRANMRKRQTEATAPESFNEDAAATVERKLHPSKAAPAEPLPFLNTRQPELARTNLRVIAAKSGKSMEFLILEALNALFAQHGLPEVHQPEGRRK